mgnify:CR=1 FL=1
MRVSKEVMAKNNAKIVSEAARLYREKGIESTSVADVMKAAGLTHGGFYRHFESKEDLALCAIRKAFDDVTDSFVADLELRDGRTALKNYVDKYLSREHVFGIGSGCPLASLSEEVNRASSTYAEELSDGRERLLNLMVVALTGSHLSNHASFSDKKMSTIKNDVTDLLVLLLGSLVVARTMEKTDDIEAVLDRGRHKAQKLLNSLTVYLS